MKRDNPLYSFESCSTVKNISIVSKKGNINKYSWETPAYDTLIAKNYIGVATPSATNPISCISWNIFFLIKTICNITFSGNNWYICLSCSYETKVSDYALIPAHPTVDQSETFNWMTTSVLGVAYIYEKQYPFCPIGVAYLGLITMASV